MKYYVNVTDILGHTCRSVVLDDYPRELDRFKELRGFFITVEDNWDPPIRPYAKYEVHYNPDHVVCIQIRVAKE